MKKIKNVLLSVLLILVLLFPMAIYAQLKVDAALRPRFEFRHGFQTPFPDNEDAAAFVSQRTRLNASYVKDKLNFYLSLQNVRVWGDVPQLNRKDNNGLGLHQAWGELLFTPEFSLKLGRQLLSYDDERILGGVAWAQQARSHDVALIKYEKSSFEFHVGIGFNQKNESLTGNILTTPNTYKSLQFARWYKDWGALSTSFLFLNNGLQYIDQDNEGNNETRFSQTFGTHTKLNLGRFSATSNLYYQLGKDINNSDLSAYMLALNLGYNLGSKWKAMFGVEYISGNNDGTALDYKNRAFTPLYGTNHKFNGLMDYFFVGNHKNNVGLLDLYLGSDFNINEKSGLHIKIHKFHSAADIGNSNSKSLGFELDIVYSYDFLAYVNIKGGYSHFFASKGIQIVKNNFDDNVNYWFWTMITIKPKLFSTKREKSFVGL